MIYKVYFHSAGHKNKFSQVRTEHFLNIVQTDEAEEGKATLMT